MLLFKFQFSWHTPSSHSEILRYRRLIIYFDAEECVCVFHTNYKFDLRKKTVSMALAHTQFLCCHSVGTSPALPKCGTRTGTHAARKILASLQQSMDFCF